MSPSGFGGRAGTPRVVVVGGGAAGTLSALHLAARGVRVTLVDPAAVPGAGRAYATTDPDHLLNVPADRMSAWPQLPGHFRGWLTGCSGVDPGPWAFVPRRRFGQYLEEQLAGAAGIEVVRATVVDIRAHLDRREVLLASGARLPADHVVLALGAPPPPSFPVPPGRFVADPLAAHALDGIRGPVLVLGTGLSMVDVTLSLSRRPDVVVTACSRSGLVPATHRATPSPAQEPPALPRGPVGYARVRSLVAGSVAAARERCGDWRPGIDALRPLTTPLWQSLSGAGRAEFLRTDRRRWDSLRHRTPPSSGARLRELAATGQLTVLPLGATRPGPAPVVLGCLGAGTDVRTIPLLDRLVGRGELRPDALRLGLDVDRAGHPRSADGRPDEGLSVIGALRLGSLWETTAVPEIRDQAVLVADRIAAAEPAGDGGLLPLGRTA